MELYNTKYNTKLNRLIFLTSFVATFSFSNIAQVSIFELPNVNIDSALTHQKELVGVNRKPQSLKVNSNANQIVSAIVYEITLKNLPEKYKKDALRISTAILDEATKYRMDPLFLLSIIRQESAFNPEAVGSVGELGLMQIRPTTAEWLNKGHKITKNKINLRDSVINIQVGAYYLNLLREKFKQNSNWYISAYNMGATKLRRKIAENIKPKEYSQNIMKHYVKYVGMLNSAFDQAQDEIELVEMPLPTVASNN